MQEARIDLDGLEELVRDAHGLVTIDAPRRGSARCASSPSRSRADWPALGLAH
ncbi:MAG: hypothetical protein QOH72_3898 [Solirubrobacteraceae bacterium]|jgi:hypothetical protein|nr:hypothetical protein [Solirubrobacteraceae bacterium]